MGRDFVPQVSIGGSDDPKINLHWLSGTNPFLPPFEVVAMNNAITCPRCRNEIEITEVMRSQLTDQIRAEFESESAVRRADLDAARKQLEKERASVEAAREIAEMRQQIDDLMEMVYNYLSGPEFRSHVAGIVEAFVTMRQDLDSEKRSMQRIWSKREKQMECALTNTARMYGDLQGIIGASLPVIDGLSVPLIGFDEEEAAGTQCLESHES